MILAHKIALDPTCDQLTCFARTCGVARFSWNWALEEWQRQYKAGEKPSEGKLRKQLNALKRADFPWMLEVTKAAPQQAIKNLGAAFKRFFEECKRVKALRARGIKARHNPACGYPQFKKKGSSDSFRAENGPDTFAVDGKRIKLPVVGWVKMREALRFTGNIRSATVSRAADRWFVSVAVEVELPEPTRENQAVAGVDLGIKALATVSDGSVYEGPKALRRNLKKLKRLSRSLSRKVKGSANRRKARTKLARLHARIANIRRDGLHKLTTDLVKRFSVIGIEDLNVAGMMRNGRLARAIADMGFYEFRRQLGYKAPMHASRIVVVDRWYPSSKTCHVCGLINDSMTLSVREWNCSGCGTHHDRDHNASCNLKNMAVSPTVTACGVEGSGVDLTVGVKPAMTKQEPECASSINA